jgi:hypothetical protein
MKATLHAALALAKVGLSVRDTGSLLGLTGARVSQILTSRERLNDLPRRLVQGRNA